MDHEYRRLLYKNSSLTLLESYIAIERFILNTRLSFLDQYKLFDLLKKLLPNEDNQLTCQGFLSWLVWRVDQYEEEERPIIKDKRSVDNENEFVNKRLKISKILHRFNNFSAFFFDFLIDLCYWLLTRSPRILDLVIYSITN
jgi:hypothetical protein